MTEFEKYFKTVNEYKDKELTLSRVNNALTSISFNELCLGKIVHIAGTNGKGSTSYFIAQLLQKYGYKVALFTSPHITKINERIKINNIDISDADFDELFRKYIFIIDKFSLTYFEAIFLLAILYFRDDNVDFTILETGLGGRFDATNTDNINNKVSVITKIAQDHIDVFGKNIFDILNEKLGIARAGSNLFVAMNSNEIVNAIKLKLPKNNIHFIKTTTFADKNYPYPYNENYQTAKAVVTHLLQKKINDENLKLPLGRYEIHNHLVFDSTHNISGLLSLKKSRIINEVDVIIFTQTKERNLDKFMLVLKTITNKIILTTIPKSERSINIDDIKCDIDKFSDPLEAYHHARKIAKKKVLIIGSFYLISYYKSVLKVTDL